MPKDMSVLNQRKSNPNGDEDENHNNTPRRTMPRARSDQDPEQSSDTSEMGEEEMNSEEALEVLSESLGLTQHRTDRSRITAPQGATEMPQPQNCGNNTFGQVHNQSVVEANGGYNHTFGAANHTFGPYAPNQNFNQNPNLTFGPQAQNPNLTFGPQSQNQNLGHNPNRTFGPHAQNQNISQNPNLTFGPHGGNQTNDFSLPLLYNSNQTFGGNPNHTFGPHAQNQNVGKNPNQTFGPHGENQNNEFALPTYNHASSEQTFYDPALADNVIRQPDGSLILTLEVQGQAGQAIQDLPVNPVTGPEAYTPVEKDMVENLVALYNANKDVTNRLRVLKIIEGMMLKNEAMAKFLIREDFCQALDEDIGTRVNISVNSDKHDPDTEECLIYDRKLQARIKKAAVGQKNEDMVKQIFEKNDRNLSFLARVYGGVPKKS